MKHQTTDCRNTQTRCVKKAEAEPAQPGSGLPGWTEVQLDLQEVVGSAAGDGSRRGRSRSHALMEEAAVDGQVSRDVCHGAIHAAAAPAPARLPGNCRNRTSPVSARDIRC